MMKSLVLLAGLVPSLALAQFDCKPEWVFNGDGNGPVMARVTAQGVFAAWRCKPSGNLQMAVVRHYYVSQSLVAAIDGIRGNPTMSAMNDVLAKYKTGDWRTDPKLIEVWGPYKAQIEALK